MRGDKKVLGGPKAVGLLALHDRDFFERLVQDPIPAMRGEVERGRLRVTEAHMVVVEALIRARMMTYPDKDPAPMWDEFHEFGLWDLEDWPLSWVEEGCRIPRDD